MSSGEGKEVTSPKSKGKTELNALKANLKSTEASGVHIPPSNTIARASEDAPESITKILKIRLSNNCTNINKRNSEKESVQDNVNQSNFEDKRSMNTKGNTGSPAADLKKIDPKEDATKSKPTTLERVPSIAPGDVDSDQDEDLLLRWDDDDEEGVNMLTFNRVVVPICLAATSVLHKRKRKAAKVGTTAGSSMADSHISQTLGSDDDSSSDEDDEESTNIYEDEDKVTPTVGRNVRAAMSHLRDIEMEEDEYEEYADWKDDSVISLEERNTEATDAHLIVMDVEVSCEKIEEGMDLEVVDESMVNMSDVCEPGVVDESVASENEIGVNEQVDSVTVEGRSARGRGQRARGRRVSARTRGARSRADETPFTWSKDYSTYHPKQETYTRTPGPTIATTDPVDVFLSVWDNDVMSMIVEETDRYAWQIISAKSETERGIPASLEWDSTSVEEMYRFFAIIILMSFCVKGSLHDYWTIGILEMPKFREIMSRNRFLTILRFLHFVDNDSQPSDLTRNKARMYKIQPIIDHCNKKYAALFVPGQFLCMDESLLLWKGKLSFAQCIRTEASRFGVKSFELCDSVTGYLVRMIMYGGEETTTERPDSGFTNPTTKVVLQLMRGYLDCGHCVVMDNWYNQFFLTRYLKEHKTDVIGTMNPRRLHVPREIKNLRPSRLKRGTMVARHCGDISLVAWMDVKLVTTMSTFHGKGTVTRQRAGKDIAKPVIVDDYNKYMGGVDLKDEILSMYLIERKRNSKWYIKVFKRMLNTSLLNSYIIYKANVSKKSGVKAMTHRMFREAVAEGLLERFPNRRDLTVKRAVDQTREARLKAAKVRHVDQHLLHCSVRTPVIPGTNAHVQKRCAQCSSESWRHMVRWMCQKCNVPLEPGECFTKYHNSK